MRLCYLMFCCVAVSLTQAATFQDNFATDPRGNGWKSFGETNLFRWNATNQNVEATWDSSKTNSYFYRSLGTILSKEDDFSFSFNLRMADIAIGTDPNKPYTFQVAIGLLNFRDATRTNFIRGSGSDAPNLVEFDYFPDSGFGATISTVMVSSNNGFSSGGFSFPFELTINDLFHVSLNYTASDRTLRTTMTKNGAPFGPMANGTLRTSFSDFRVDSISVSSYSDAGQDLMDAGSILAHGTVDNFIVTVPSPPIQNLIGTLTNGGWQMEFVSRTNWIYNLERTTDLITWNPLSSAAGNGTNLTLIDSNLPPSNAFYRITADRP